MSALPAAPSRPLWYTRCAVPTASSLAWQQGWLQQAFAEVDIPLESVRAAEDEAVRGSHYDNSLRNQFREGGNVPALWARARGAPTVVVGITWVDEFQGIVVREDAPLQVAADLRGRRLALPEHPGNFVDHGRASALHGFVSALSIGGLTPDDGRFVDVPAPRLDIREDRGSGQLAQRGGGGQAVLQALRAGTVDAAYVKGPGGVRTLREGGLRLLLDLNEQADPLLRVNNAVPRPITADRRLLAEEPALVVRYLEVLVRAGRWAAQHPAEALALVARETGSTEADARQAYGPRLHDHLAPTLAPDVVAGLARQKDFLRDWRFLPQDFEIADWIVPGPLAEAERRVAAQPL